MPRPHDKLVFFACLAQAEWRKLVKSRGFWFVTAISMIATTVLGFVQASHSLRDVYFGDILKYTPSTSDYRGIIGYAFTVVYSVGVLGALFGSAEWSERTQGTTFRIVGRRNRVFAAKVIAITVATLGLSVVAIACVTLGALLGARNVNAGLLWSSAIRILPRLFLAASLVGAIWLAIGELVRSRVIALVIAIFEMFLLARILVETSPSVSRWLPEFAAQGISPAGSGLSYQALAPPGPHNGFLNPPSTGVATLYLFALALFTLLVATFTIGRTDVTR
ncbi:MAG: ABC transporter permease [Acidobacteria bacterium]|nr:ABC transporter permease [Acidobacteriota bacterium]